MDLFIDTAIVNIALFSNQTAFPSGYKMIWKTSPDLQDADLLQDSAIFRKSCRYLGYELYSIDQKKSNTTQVITELAIKDENNISSVDGHVVKYFFDKHAKPILKNKKVIVAYFSILSECNSYLTDLIVLSNKRPVKDYTLVGDIGNRALYCRYQKNTKYNTNSLSFVGTSDKSVFSTLPLRKPNTHPMFGVPIEVVKNQMSCDVSLAMDLKNLMPKSLQALEQEYNYDFTTEHSIVAIKK